ncbi:MAG: O-antigen ligase family protein [Bacteroidales bacterium]|nr:O-antigen ligase family protein [Bacteroidales bacterium]
MNYRLFLWATAGFIYCLLNALFIARDVEVAIWSTIELYLPFAIISFLPIDDDWQKYLKYFVAIIVILLSAEVFLYSSGIMEYSIPLGKSRLGEYIRISTTAGSATATGQVLFLLGVWCTDLWKNNRYFVLLITVVNVIGIGSTFSRGSIIMVILSFVVVVVSYLFSAILTKKSIKRYLVLLITFIFFCVTLVVIASKIGLIAAIQQRTEQEDTIADSRVERFNEALDVFYSSPIFGVGIGQYYNRMRFDNSSFRAIGNTSPHNQYLLILVETGILGVTLLLAGYIIVIRNILRKWRSNHYGLALLNIFMIGMNTENILVEYKYNILFAIVIAWFIRKEKAA